LFTLQTNTLPRFPIWSCLRSTFLSFYRGVFIILLFPELSPPITRKNFRIKLSCVVEDNEKLTYIIEAEQVLFKSHARFCRWTAKSSSCFRKPDKVAGFCPWHGAGNWLESVTYRKCCFVRKMVPITNYLLTLLARDRTEEYWLSVVFVRTSLRSVSTTTTSGQYSPIRPSRSVSKRLIFQRLSWPSSCLNTKFRYNRTSPSPFYKLNSFLRRHYGGDRQNNRMTWKSTYFPGYKWNTNDNAR